jgi:hypothetical protein
MIKLYELSMENGEPFFEVSIKKITTAIHQKETAIKNVVKMLGQANFIKKVGETGVRLTQQGLAFVQKEIS